MNVGANTLSLTSGAITQGGTAVVTAGTLTGTTTGAVNLGTAANAVSNLGMFSTGNNDFTLTDNAMTALVITGAVTVGAANTLSLTANGITQTAAIAAGTLAGGGTGAVTLSNTGNNVANLGPISNTAGNFTLNDGTNALAIGGTVTVGTNTLSLTAGNLTQSAAITAGTLTLSIGDGSAAQTGHNATLTAANQIGTLGNITVAQGDLQLTDAQALTVSSGSTVTGRDVTLTTTGAGSTLLVNGAVGACAIDAATAGAVSLTAADMLTITTTVGGERTTTLSGSSVAVNATGFLEAGRSGVAPINGTLSVTGALTLTGGTIAANTVTAGAVTQNGGTVVAPNLTTTSYTFNSGTLDTNNALTLSLPNLPSGSSISAGALTITGTTNNFTSAGSLNSSANLTLMLPGSFSQTAGTLSAGGTLFIGGSNTTTGAPGTISQSGGTLAAGTQLTLYALGTGPVSIAGTVSAPNLQVLEPGAALTIATTALTGASTTTAPSYTLSLHCPSCDGMSPSVTTTGLSVVVSGTPTTVRFDGLSLSLASTLSTGSLELHSGGSTSQTAITAGTVLGTAGYTAVTSGGLPTYNASAGNGAAVVLSGAIGAIGPYYTDGGLSVTSSIGLTVADQIVAGGNQAVSLTAPSISVNDAIRFGSVSGGAFATSTRPVTANAGTFTAATTTATANVFDTVTLRADALAIGAAITAPGGAVILAPLTSGKPVTVDAVRNTSGTSLSLASADLSNIQVLGSSSDAGPQLLRIGSLDGVTPLAGGITINAPFTLTNSAATLALYASGNITEATGAGVSIGRQAAAGVLAETGTIIGTAGGTVLLGGPTDATPANHFDVLGSFTAGAGFSVSDMADANSGRSGLTVAGTVTSGAGGLGILGVGLGGVGGTVSINGTLNATGQTLTLAARNGAGTAAAITTGGASLLQAATLTGSAQTTSGTGYDVLLNGGTVMVGTLGAFTVGTPQGSAVTPQGAFRLVDASSLVVNGQVAARSVAVTASSLVIAGDVGAGIAGGGGDVTLAASAGNIAMQSGTVGGQASLTLTALGGVGVTGGTLDAPTVTFASGTSLALSAGTVFGDTVTVGGTATQTGGTLHAGATLSTGGLTFSNGDLYAGNGLTFSVPTGVLGGSAVTPGALTASGTGIVSAGTLVAGGALTINDGGSFTQVGGTIAGGGSLAVTASNVVNQSGGAMLTGGTLLLRGFGTGAATIAGQLSGNSIAVVEPGAALSFMPAAFSGDHALRGAATISSGTLTDSFVCPGCTPLGTGTTLAGVFATPGPYRPTALRLDGATLALGSGALVLAADAVELHSAGSTVQTGGSLEAASIIGTAGYAGSADTVPVYGTTLSGATVATLSLTQPANNIAAINGYQVLGDTTAGGTAGLVIADTPGAQTTATGGMVVPAGLTLNGTIRAGLASDPIDPASGSAKNATIVSGGPNGTLVLGGTLAGRVVALYSAGATREAGGSIVAATLVGSAGSAALASANQILTLGPYTTAGDFALFDNHDLTITGAVLAGPATPTSAAPGLALSTTGNLDINGGSLTAGTVAINATTITETNGYIYANTLALNTALANVTSGQNNVTVLSSVNSPNGFAFTDNGSLIVNGPLVASNGSILLQASGDLLTQGTVNAAGDVRLGSGGATTVAAGSNVTGATITTTAGGTATIAGTVTAGGPIQVTGTAVALSGVISGGSSIVLTAGPGALIQSAGSVSGATLATMSGGLSSFAGTLGTIGQLSVTANGATFTPSSILKSGSLVIAGGNGALEQAGGAQVNGDVVEKTTGSATLSGSLSAAGAIAVSANGASVPGVVQSLGRTVTIDAGGGPLVQTGRVAAPGAIVEKTGSTASLSGTTTTSTSLTVSANGGLVLAGTEVAPLFTATAPAVTLASGSITTGGVEQARNAMTESLPTAKTATTGFFVEAGSQVTQTGLTTIVASDGAPNATVRIDLTSGSGTMALSNLQAPSTNLILDLGSGAVAGTINVHELTIIHSGMGFVAAGSADLDGTVGGVGGSAAAGAAAISSQSRNYRINSCAIGGVNCAVLEPQTVPIGDPLKELVLSFFRQQDDNDDLLLPNVTDQGL